MQLRKKKKKLPVVWHRCREPMPVLSCKFSLRPSLKYLLTIKSILLQPLKWENTFSYRTSANFSDVSPRVTSISFTMGDKSTTAADELLIVYSIVNSEWWRFSQYLRLVSVVQRRTSFCKALDNTKQFCFRWKQWPLSSYFGSGS